MTQCMQCDNGTLVCRCGPITEQEGDVIEWIDEENKRRALENLAVHGTCFTKVLGQRRWYIPYSNVVKTKLDQVAIYVVREGGSDD